MKYTLALKKQTEAEKGRKLTRGGKDDTKDEEDDSYENLNENEDSEELNNRRTTNLHLNKQAPFNY